MEKLCEKSKNQVTRLLNYKKIKKKMLFGHVILIDKIPKTWTNPLFSLKAIDKTYEPIIMHNETLILVA